MGMVIKTLFVSLTWKQKDKKYYDACGYKYVALAAASFQPNGVKLITFYAEIMTLKMNF